MKKAKAHLSFENIPMWQRARDALASCCDKVYFSISSQLDQPIPLSSDLLIEDQLKACGPLGGIISAFKHAPQNTWFVLACDMPYFSSDCAGELLSQRDPAKLASCYHNAQYEPEPLAAFYEPEIFSHLLSAWGNSLYCPRQILNLLDSKNINLIKPNNNNYLKNINYSEEWENLHENNKQNLQKITIYYYASLRGITNCAQECVNTSAQTIAELYNYLAYKYKITIDEKSLRFAKNNELVSICEAITEGDHVAILPTVSGG